MADYGNPTADQRSKSGELDRKFNYEIRDLRYEIWTKSIYMDVVVNINNREREKIKSLQSEISNLRTKMDERTLVYPLETA